MKILHWMKKENSGLARTTLELAKYEEKAGHVISIRHPGTGDTIHGFRDDDFDIHCIHSQIHPHYYKDDKPKILFLHGEPEYGIINKISMEAIMDLLPLADALITFQEAEQTLWNSFKRTYYVPKGIDLEVFKPSDIGKKLVGTPSILYAEHWRSFRHPLHVFIALEQVFKKLPKMRFYPFGCPEEQKTFWMRIIKQNKYMLFTKRVFKPQKYMTTLLNLVDMVISPVYPSYGRVGLEALACNKPLIAYNTNPHATYKCEPYNPSDIARKVLQCWEERPNNQRQYAEKHLDIKDTVDQILDIFRRFL